jgi:hypothetical protein
MARRPALGVRESCFQSLFTLTPCELDSLEVQPDVENLLTGLTWRSLLTGTGDRFQYVL